MIEGNGIKAGYGKHIVLDDIDFTIEKGINGFLGANGVGKSTLFKLILGQLKPVSGTLHIQMPPKASFMGYLPQRFVGYPEMSIREFLYFMAKLRQGEKHGEKRKREEEVEKKLHIFSLEKMAHKRLKKLSGGQLRRVGLAQATLFDPYIIILDEPTTGLDPNERIKFRKYLTELSENRIILLSTHIVSDLDGLANQIFILKDHKIILRGRQEEILQSYPLKAYQYITKDSGMIPVLEQKFLISNVHKNCEDYEVRLLSTQALSSDFSEVSLKLEDIYYVNFSREIDRDEI